MQNRIVAELKKQIKEAEATAARSRAALSALNASGARKGVGRKPGSKVSPATLAKMRKAAKKRWAKIKANGK